MDTTIPDHGGQEFVALFRRTASALLFSNPTAVDSLKQLPKLSGELQYLTVHPSVSSTTSKKTLKDIIDAMPTQAPKTPQPSVKSDLQEPLPLDFGPFASFAPQYDSRVSTIPSDQLLLANSTIKAKHDQAALNKDIDELLSKASSVLLSNNLTVELDTMGNDALSGEDDLQLEALIRATLTDDQGKRAPSSTDELLSRNSEILVKLNQLQQERVQANKIDQVSETEQRLEVGVPRKFYRRTL
ncbi:hypothetical protein EV182_000596 [Spiromyces aspiralis]|uniref:Uncharacterized protein n=1 Tax=Spiromyces aspiralis TaxID=68401 RepID=A0ACC1HUA7_9FUNG|nr:hypothetical protein EV182_000596 [Spiromyces aspiralis]